MSSTTHSLFAKKDKNRKRKLFDSNNKFCYISIETFLKRWLKKIKVILVTKYLAEHKLINLMCTLRCTYAVTKCPLIKKMVKSCIERNHVGRKSMQLSRVQQYYFQTVSKNPFIILLVQYISIILKIN